MTSAAGYALLSGAGVIAGAVGSAGGITSLISYPALLAAGLPPLQANVTQAVALVACLPGSALSSRPELRGQGTWLRRWAALAAAGSAAGVVILLATPSQLFARVVPFLLVLGSLAIIAQPRITAWRDRRARSAHRLLLPCGLLAVSIYNGYFGAGSGIMVLALILLTANQNLPQANALKNVLLGIADVTAAAGFAFFGPVRWPCAAALAVGLIVGSSLGPAITRRVPPSVLRVLVAIAGTGLAIRLWLAPL
ncbi:MAG TPA: sulfite exporter TauE/SafE family protein [Streptosporangiaceae bacterium]|nr:sulfite exporter TauE/SafE family protein [Streptosporangiaceae bacterium]